MKVFVVSLPAASFAFTVIEYSPAGVARVPLIVNFVSSKLKPPGNPITSQFVIQTLSVPVRIIGTIVAFV